MVFEDADVERAVDRLRKGQVYGDMYVGTVYGTIKKKYWDSALLLIQQLIGQDTEVTFSKKISKTSIHERVISGRLNEKMYGGNVTEGNEVQMTVVYARIVRRRINGQWVRQPLDDSCHCTVQ